MDVSEVPANGFKIPFCLKTAATTNKQADIDQLPNIKLDPFSIIT